MKKELMFKEADLPSIQGMSIGREVTFKVTGKISEICKGGYMGAVEDRIENNDTTYCVEISKLEGLNKKSRRVY